MKFLKIPLYLLISIMCLGCNSEPSTVIMQKADKPIVIDGKIDHSWEKSKWTGISNISKSNGQVSKKDFSAAFKMLWNSANCYFLFKITDDYIYIKPPVNSLIERKYRPYIQGEGIQLFIAKNNRGWNLDNNIYKKYGFTYKDDTIKVEGTASIDAIKRNVNYRYMDSTNGYLLEVSIPWKELELNPRMSTSFRLEVLLTDNDGVEYESGVIPNAETYMCWSNVNGPPYYGDSNLYGKVLIEH